jgi:hypothetical protein
MGKTDQAQKTFSLWLLKRGESAMTSHHPHAAAGSSDDGVNVSWSILLGIGLLMAGCTVDNIGITLQKIAHRHQTHAPATNKCYASDVRWTAGLLLYLSGNALNAMALPFTPQSLYAALGSTTLVINVL